MGPRVIFQQSRGQLTRHQRLFSTTTARHADFTHAVIGGGVVGLAIARRLQQRDGASTVLIERHGAVGTETSSRNSEVIHAGLYYGPSSLKAQLCVKGKALLYSLCEANSIPHKRIGKLIVAQNAAQREALEGLHRTAQTLSIPTEFLTAEEVRRREPAVRAEAGALWSPSTGIVDSHALMSHLHEAFTTAGGDTALHSSLDSASHNGSEWTLSIKSADELATVTSETLINAAGLAAIPLSNSLLPKERHITPHYAKGTYWTYPRREPRVSTLIYPAPVPGHGGLGTHLTLDLQGQVRFGPDVQWTSDPADLTPRDDDPAHRAAALDEVRAYLPSVEAEALQVDYCGIRPKLAGPKEGGGDFYIRREEGLPGFVNLLGIESPGLTSSLAIAEYVHDLLYR
ncbi:hypothetical protein ANO11243_026720 [Dothideomycetidae sp. 11243]|nr:hypothetical protein ANO11243_026720 [fungal sp. No.11243]